jgi:hypothetical protein
MYFLTVALLLIVLPSASVCIEVFLHHGEISIITLMGQWWTFWAVGIRLFIAGVRQVVQPRFTAEEIFQIHDPASFPIVREVGFGNLAMGILGICCLSRSEWLVPAAIVGGLYYGFAGLGHVPQKEKNSKEWTAMASDLLVCLLLAIFVCKALF